MRELSALETPMRLATAMACSWSICSSSERSSASISSAGDVGTVGFGFERGDGFHPALDFAVARGSFAAFACRLP